MRRCFPLVLLTLAAARSTTAQSLPTDPAHEVRRNQREEFLSVTYQEIKQVLQEWRDLVARGDTQALARAVTENVFFTPAEGWRTSGRAELADSAGRWLATVRNYSLAPVEFDASGSLAFVVAHVQYERVGSAGAPNEFVSGDCLMVFYQEGRKWKLRNYFERIN